MISRNVGRLALARGRAFFFLSVGTMLLAGSRLEAGDVEVKCWNQYLFDKDGDGYAVASANPDHRFELLTSPEYQLTCPPGWVKARGDCDDNDPQVRPRRSELYGNDTDDNCDGRVDEPTFGYSYAGYDNEPTGFSMKTYVRDPDVMDVWYSSDTLAYRVEYQSLSNTDVTNVTPTRSVTSMTGTATTLRVDGLTPETVYRARVQFYRGVYLFPKSGPFWFGKMTYTPVGEPSDWYYTATDATYELGRARTRLLLRAFLETYYSSIGYTGYRGYGRPDGTRYGGDVGEKWCSEYYSFVLDHELAGVGHRASVSQVIGYFQARGAFTSVNDPSDYLSSARPGDYVAMDTNDDGKKNHSALFLAYDIATNEMWTADGNTSGGSPWGGRYAGNEAHLRSRDPGVVHGWGRILYSMLP